MAGKVFTGGGKLMDKLREIEDGLKNDPTVNVGFFSGSKESKTGTPSAYVALINEYGGTVTDKAGKKRTTPPRPFFRNMIAKGKPHWGEDLGNYLIQTKLDAEKSLKFMGVQMSEELQDSIQAPGYAPLKESTVKRKGHSQTLIDSADMLRAVDFQIEE